MCHVSCCGVPRNVNERNCSTSVLDLVFIFFPRDFHFRGNEQSEMGNIMHTPQNLNLAIPTAKRRNTLMAVHMTSDKFISTEYLEKVFRNIKKRSNLQVSRLNIQCLQFR